MIELRILGALDLRTADGRVLDEALRRSKRVALLAYVAAARPGGFLRRDKLAALFWPDLDKERARGALRTTLSRLRDDLGDDVIESRGAEEIAIRRDRLWCDLGELYDCLARDDAAGAADLYRGPMLDGVHIPGTSDELEQWISDERTAVRGALLAGAATQIDRYVAAGDWGAALPLAQRACLVAPDDELAARRLVRVALGAGDRGAALRAYEEIERVLRREYDVAPSDETTVLVAQLRRAGSAADTPANAARGGGAISFATGASAASNSGRTAQAESPRPVAGASHRYGLAAAMLVLAIAGTWQVARIGMIPDTVSSAPAGSWRRIESSAGVAPARHHFRLALDSTGNGVLAIGGARATSQRTPDGSGAWQTLEPIGTEVWRLLGLRDGAASQWARVSIRPGPAPKPRWMFGAAFDPTSDQWFIHGGALGWTSPCANDTWILDHASGIAGQPAWRSVRTRGAMPKLRAGFDLSFDKHRRKLIAFGGNDCVNTYFNDTWVLAFDDATYSTGTWTQIFPDSSEGQPFTRNGYASVYDTATARLFVYGGSTPMKVATAELWVLDHTDGVTGAPRWHALACAGAAPPLGSPAHAYDSAHDSWFFFGGGDATGTVRRELWRLDGMMRDPRSCRWSRVAFTEPWPIPRTSGAAVWLAAQNAFVTFGGYSEKFSLSDVWVFTEPARR